MGLEEAYSKLQWNELEKQLQSLYPQWDISLFQLVQMIIQGRGMEALGQITDGLKENILLEWATWKNIFITITIVILLSAIFVTFKDAFQNHQIADISFYINYLILVILFTSLFQSMLETGEATLSRIEEFMRIFFPAYFMTLGIAAGAATGIIYYQLACLVIYLVELLLKSILLPAISAYMLFSIMNGVWGEDRLDLLLDLWRKGMKTGLKLLLGLLTGAGIIQSMITPVMEKVKSETVYKAVEAIPGVGDLTEGAMRLWLGSTVLIKNSIGVVGCILLVAITLAPLLKIAAAGLMLKAVAALMGMVGDKRVIRFTSCVGDGILLLLQTVAYGVLFFFVLIAITAYTTNGGF